MFIINYTDENDFLKKSSRPASKTSEIEPVVKDVLDKVKTQGDKALRELSEKFDGSCPESFLVSEKEFEAAEKEVPEDLKAAINIAKDNIEKFHKSQLQNGIKKVETSKGVVCWQKAVGIEKVGIYIPGGNAPLFSTVLMLAIPAKLAGCKEIVLCSPPRSGGNINSVVLYCAKLLGVTKVFKIGGAQAIAAMAYGTESVPKVFKIFGPGNRFVTVAKQLVSSSETAIDMPAGPSELAVIADENTNAVYAAADLLSQCEHGSDSQVGLFVSSKDKMTEIIAEAERQLELLPRKDAAKKSFENSFAVLTKDGFESVKLTNLWAPEHLVINTDNALQLSENVVNAGSVFIGKYACESAGDYASGTNHTLPTCRAANAYSGLNMDSFTKKITFQTIDEEGIKNIGKAIETMAAAEDLFAHKNAVTVRLKKLPTETP
ncbi:MAG: histidinol dehydrogenase [Bacteroidales bacterium]|nr:histidinol dehydrogenase [Bacteroidales bacterium]